MLVYWTRMVLRQQHNNNLDEEIIRFSACQNIWQRLGMRRAFYECNSSCLSSIVPPMGPAVNASLHCADQLKLPNDCVEAGAAAPQKDARNSEAKPVFQTSGQDYVKTPLLNPSKFQASLETSLKDAEQNTAFEGRIREDTLLNLVETKQKAAVSDAQGKTCTEVFTAPHKAQQRYIEYTFEELKEAASNFCESLKLGEGGYGAVYRGVIHHTPVAIKILKAGGWQGYKEFQHEVELLSQIHHPNVVTLIGAGTEHGCIVYEYMANGSLEDRLTCKNGTPPLPWHIRFRICFEVAAALLFLHKFRPEPIIHRDLKPGNILLDHNFVSKISDVALARFVPNNATYTVTIYRDTKLVGTLPYMDPEYHRSGMYGPHSDVYALGIIMLQLLTGRPPVGITYLVEKAMESGTLHKILDTSAGEWPLPEAMKLARLALSCAALNRKHRPDLKAHVLDTLQNLRDVGEAAAVGKEITTSTRTLLFTCCHW